MSVLAPAFRAASTSVSINRAAVKVLPVARANDPASLERFYREARVLAALSHPNIVRAYDIDQEDNLHFLVMEYVDGSSLQDITEKCGPMGRLPAPKWGERLRSRKKWRLP